MKISKRVLALILGATMILPVGLTACHVNVNVQTEESETSTEATTIEPTEIDTKPAADASDFSDFAITNADLSFEVLKERNREAGASQNLLFSPLSLYEDFSMAANGAAGKTAEEMYSVLGDERDVVNSTVAEFNGRLPESINVANSIWVNEVAGALNDDFQTNVTGWFDSRIASVPYNDDIVKEINNWVNDKTKGMIPTLVNKLEPDEMMHLINAVAFDSEWLEEYEDSQIVEDDVFANAEGEEETVSMLYSDESTYLQYKKNGTLLAQGFVKPYKDGATGFLALLPEKDHSVSEVLETMTGYDFYDMYDERQSRTVKTKIPEFTFDDKMELTAPLMSMGVNLAFTGSADFSNMLQNKEVPLHISGIIQKTHIELNRHGTKAAAATDIVMETTAFMESEETVVHLDRPFIYAIIDLETGVPYFVGVQNSIQ